MSDDATAEHLASEDAATTEARAIRKRLYGRGLELMVEAGISEDHVPNEPIYHYTTAAGLIGILTNKKIWATHGAYLNDTTELAYGRMVVVRHLERLCEPLDSQVVPTFDIRKTPEEMMASVPLEKLAPWALLNGLKESIRSYMERQYYISSFCESGDLLSQWRGYSNQGGGYSIGIRFKQPKHSMDEDHHYQLIKLLYNQDKQRHIVERIASAALDELNQIIPVIGDKGHLNQDQPHFAAIVEAANALLRLIPLRFKAPGFEEEQEWRLYTGMLNNVVNDQKFRDVKGLLTPYVELGLNLPTIEVVSVRCGPTLHPGLAINSVEMLLAQHGYDKVEVTHSSIPFKGF